MTRNLYRRMEALEEQLVPPATVQHVIHIEFVAPGGEVVERFKPIFVPVEVGKARRKWRR